MGELYQSEAKTQIKSQDKRNFVMIPNDIIRAAHPPYYISVLLVIASYAGDSGKCFALQDTISKTIGVGTRTIMRAIQYWEGLGLLLVERRNGMNSVICTAFDFTKTTCDSRVTGDSPVTGAVTPESQGAVTPESHIRKTYTRKTIKKIHPSADAEPVGEVGGVNALLGAFYDSNNPAIRWNNKTMRKDAAWLIENHGLDKAIEITKWAIKVQGQQFAPVITNPTQLRDKLGALKIFSDRLQNGGDRKPSQQWHIAK